MLLRIRVSCRRRVSSRRFVGSACPRGGQQRQHLRRRKLRRPALQAVRLQGNGRAYRQYASTAETVGVHHGCALAEEFDGDLRRDFVDCPAYFLRGVGQPSCVDVYSYTTLRTLHVLTQFKIPNCLPEFVPAFRTLKSDRMCVNVSHPSPFPPSLSCFRTLGIGSATINVPASKPVPSEDSRDPPHP